MSLVQIGDIYINKRKLTGVTDVQRNEVPGEGVEAAFTFMILLEGGETSVVTKSKNDADAWHDKLVAAINPGYRFGSGGVTLSSPYVNSIGPVTAEGKEVNPLPAGFIVGMDGVTVNLRYADAAKAEAARKELVAKVGTE